MKAITRKEIAVLTALGVLVLAALMPALHYARQEERDGVRRSELIAFKRLLEQHHNEHGRYPLNFDASPHKYVVLEEQEGGAEAWYLRAKLENKAAEIADFDLEHNVYYRIVRADNRTYYDICGGEFRCGVAEKNPNR